MTRRPAISVIDADEVFRAALAEYLTALGYDVRVARSAPEEAWRLDRHPPDLILLDIDGAGGSDLSALRDLLDARRIALVAMTRSPDPVDRVAGLETGADDVVEKPVAPQELAARIAGILERRGIGRRDVVRLERTTVDLSSSNLLRHGRAPERLGPGEIVLLQVFVRNPNRVLTRRDLLDMAPAESLDTNDRAIDARVARLRRKLDTEAIATVRNHGYVFVPPFDGSAPASRDDRAAHGLHPRPASV